MRKPRSFAAWSFGILLLLTAACSAAPAEMTSPPALPTAQVPPVTEIDEAFQRWQASGNTSYLAEVEERRPDGHHKFLVVVSDGQVRAAQVLERQAGGAWSAPAALPLEAARAYTPPGIFERLRQDALERDLARLI